MFIYTIWLKRSTPQNIVIGGAAGAFPPMIGWASVTNSITIEACILFLIIFLWTPPHFWALALYRSDDYKAANIPMLSVTHGIDYTKKQILLYSVAMLASTILPYLVGMCGLLYLSIAMVSGGKFVIDAYKLYKSQDLELAPKLFGYSILYLFIIFIAMMCDKIFNMM